MNIFNSELWPIPLLGFGVAYFLYYQAKGYVKRGTYTVHTRADGSKYKEFQPDNIKPWWHHKLGWGAILLMVLAIAFIFVGPWAFNKFG